MSGTGRQKRDCSVVGATTQERVESGGVHGTEALLDDAPLNDPDYAPAYPPIDGRVPPEVARFGPRSQLRWFARHFDMLRDTSARALDDYYINSTMHTGAC